MVTQTISIILISSYLKIMSNLFYVKHFHVLYNIRFSSILIPRGCLQIGGISPFVFQRKSAQWGETRVHGQSNLTTVKG